MKFAHLVVLGLLFGGAAFAQSPGTLNLIGPSTTPGAAQITRVDQINGPINAAMAAKADATNGILTTPTITGGTIAGTPISGAPGAFTTLSASGTMTGATGLFTALSASGNGTIGGTLGVTGALTGTTATFTGQATLAGIQSTSSSTQLGFKDGPGGAFMLLLGGTSNDIVPMTDIHLQGGTWGAGALANNLPPIYQNATFAGTNAGAAVAFGAFLQQVDTSSVPSAPGWGIFEHLTLNGAGVTGQRTAGQFTLDILATGNVARQEYVALGSKCNLMTSEGNQTSCFGLNPVAHVGPGVTALTVVGGEFNTWIEATATVQDKFGVAIVDVAGSIQATEDDIGLTINNQYAPTSTLGYRTGIEFGKTGGYFPVSTTGTLIYGQGHLGIGWTVANGIDWGLGTATGNWIQFGSVFAVSGAGAITAPAIGNGASALKISGAGQWSANGAVVTTVTGVGPTGSHTTIQEWLTVTDSAGTVRYIPAY